MIELKKKNKHNKIIFRKLTTINITSISLSPDKILYLPCEEKQYKMGSSKKHVVCIAYILIALQIFK